MPSIAAASVVNFVNEEMDWHKRLNHPAADLMAQLLGFVTYFPRFPQSVLRKPMSVTFSVYKSRRATIWPEPKETMKALECVKIDVLR